MGLLACGCCWLARGEGECPRRPQLGLRLCGLAPAPAARPLLLGGGEDKGKGDLGEGDPSAMLWKEPAGLRSLSSSSGTRVLSPSPQSRGRLAVSLGAVAVCVLSRNWPGLVVMPAVATTPVDEGDQKWLLLFSCWTPVPVPRRCHRRRLPPTCR